MITLETKGSLRYFVGHQAMYGFTETAPNQFSVDNELMKSTVHYDSFQKGEMESVILMGQTSTYVKIKFNEGDDKEEKFWIVASLELKPNQTYAFFPHACKEPKPVNVPIAFAVFNSKVAFDISLNPSNTETISLMLCVSKSWIKKHLTQNSGVSSKDFIKTIFGSDFMLFDDMRVMPKLVKEAYQLCDFENKHFRRIHAEANVLTFVSSVLDYLSNKLNCNVHNVKTGEYERIQQFTRETLENLMQPVPVMAKVADDFGMSVSKFKTLFKEVNGDSYYRFFLIERLKKSQHLLKEGRLNISEISYKIGFQYPTNFIKTFRQEFGISPAKFQKHF